MPGNRPRRAWTERPKSFGVLFPRFLARFTVARRGGTIKRAFGTSIDGLSVSAAKKYTADLAVYGNVASRRNNTLVGQASPLSLSLLSRREKLIPRVARQNLPISARDRRFLAVAPRWCWDRIRYPSSRPRLSLGLCNTRTRFSSQPRSPAFTFSGADYF